MILVRIESTRGSSPREAGAEMVVDRDHVHGTIGGGALEYMAIDTARQMLRDGATNRMMDVPLGPEIGQCCGGRVWLSLTNIDHIPPERPRPLVLVFGAGHVGRALSRALAALPLRTMVVDSRTGELSQVEGDTRLTPLPEAEIRAAPPGSAYVIVTHDHALDFLLAAEALSRGDAGYVGMIGSKTKRATFQRFARDRGLGTDGLTCPIGANTTGDKRPEIIAAFTAAEILTHLAAHARQGQTQT